VLARPAAELSGFGSSLRIGDVDGDGHLDVVEGAPAGARAGHGSWCRGSAAGPRSCHVAGPPRSVSALALADVDGDDAAEVIEGDPGPPSDIRPGLVRIYGDGPEEPPVTVRQAGGRDHTHDLFGTTVTAGDLDDDGYAEIVIAAPERSPGASSVTVIAGGPDIEAAGRRTYRPRDVGAPDAEVIGRGLAILDVAGDARRDLVMGTTRLDGGDAAVVVLTHRGAPPVARTPLEHVALPPGTDPRDAPLRIGRPVPG
jgi:FG-GAP repeat